MARSTQPLRLVIAGGGTGGHVSPALAVLDALQRRGALEALWVGARGGLEARTAAERGIPFRAVRVGKLRRYASWATPVDAVRVPVGVGEAWRALRRFRPDVVFATGGSISVPSVVAAWLLGVPRLTHEQTAYVGLATRVNARFGAVVALSFERSSAALGAVRVKTVVTGNPVRDAVLHGEGDRARRAFDLPASTPLVYVTGGAQGAHALNVAVGEALPRLLERVALVHQCGAVASNGDIDRLRERAAQLPEVLRCRYRPVEFVRCELGDLYAAATLVVARSGAGTVAELAALGLPSILVPLPGATEQRLNALQLVERGAAVLLPQDELSPERLTRDVTVLLDEPATLARMRAAALTAARLDAADRLADELIELAQRPAHW